MPSFAGKIDNGQIIFVTGVSLFGKSGAEANRQTYHALLDTGAQVTMISQKVANDLGLQPIGHLSIVPVTG